MKKGLLLTLAVLLAPIATASAQGDRPPHMWLGPISEEQGEGWCQLYDDPNNPSDGIQIVTRAFCAGSHCDNNWIYCRWPSELGVSVPIAGMDQVFRPYTSEEHFSSDPYRAVCPFGYAIRALGASGKDSASVAPVCVRVDLPPLPSPGYWVTGFDAPFSSGYSQEVSPWGFMSGLKCSGSYCGTMYYHMTFKMYFY